MRCAKQLLAALSLAIVALAAHAGAPANAIEELTWNEVHARIAAGATTVLVPIGGTEQNGPYMVIGKHNARVKVLAAAIAQRLGNALVAPVIAYVPEGAINPPAAHMRFAGTISIPETAFEAMLEATARSFRQHGFRHVVFLGDHGGYQKNEQRVAERLNAQWAKDRACTVHALAEYYQASQRPYFAALKKRGITEAEIGVHAGLADTALTLAVDPALVREAALAHAAKPAAADGVNGDPRRATRELGQLGVDQIIQDSVAAITQLTRKPR
ncbi:MAG: creatininase family protein [Bdellovibrionales bacterium]|nr:creatininase family protein [Massilia sp.]